MRTSVIALILLAILVAGATAQNVTTYTSETAWVTAAGGGVFHHLDFDTIAHGTYLNDPALVATHAAMGIQFLPFGNGGYPQVQINGGAWSAPNLIGNFADPGFDEMANGIRWEFTVPVYAVGWYHNIADLNTYRIYDAAGNKIGELVQPYSFGGFVSDVPLAMVTSIDLPPQDGLFGVDNIMFFDGTGVVDNETESWSGVKALFR